MTLYISSGGCGNSDWMDIGGDAQETNGSESLELGRTRQMLTMSPDLDQNRNRISCPP